ERQQILVAIGGWLATRRGGQVIRESCLKHFGKVNGASLFPRLNPLLDNPPIWIHQRRHTLNRVSLRRLKRLAALRLLLDIITARCVAYLRNAKSWHYRLRARKSALCGPHKPIVE